MYKPKFLIEKEDLYKLYWLKKKSTVAIAKIYNCNHDTISNRLREFNIPIRSKYKIPKKKLLKLYLKENKSPHFIGKLYGCSFSTVTNRLKKYGIPEKSQSLSRMRYKKFNFSNKLVEKAYLIGFRIGDLRVYKTNKHAETVIVQCHTTCDNQIKLIKELFGRYGKVTLTNLKNNSTDINCFLNKSFEFLLPKKDNIENWIYRDSKNFCGFMAGYIDTEGNFIINQGRARFKIDSYDKNVLKKIHRWLNENGVRSKFRKIGKKGELRPEGYCFNKDLWRLNVNEANSLSRFINFIKPFILHKKRLKDINLCSRNILKRKRLRTI